MVKPAPFKEKILSSFQGEKYPETGFNRVREHSHLQKKETPHLQMVKIRISALLSKFINPPHLTLSL